MKDKIKIGLFIDTFFPMVDGVCMVVDNYARRLVKYGDVTVFAPEYAGAKYDDSKFPYRVVRCKSLKAPVIDYSIPIPKWDRKFMKILEEYDLDIVHIHSPFMLGKLGVKYAKKHHIPAVATMHSQFKQDFQRAVKLNGFATLLTNVVIKVFNQCDECWAVNSEVARIFYEDYKYHTLPKVMNNSTDMKPVKDSQKARELINQKHQIKDDEKVFLFVGRINNLKNVFFIADSLKVLKENEPDLKFKMLYVGTGQDEEKLKEIITQNHMNDEIIMCGKVMDRELLAAYFHRADLFLFPSLYDASSIVQIEAASQKTPCLFVEGAATTATVTDGKNGFISKNDISEYAKDIAHIMKNEELYQSVSEACYHDLYKNWDDTIAEVYERYLELIKKNI
ncbi:MAG: glycosyltransferase [Clostridia bacterium]|nr:glycosyltransferase [Clostridia bacterium]